MWIFDLLVEQGLLPPRTAAEKLLHLRSLERFLTEKECQIRIGRWQGVL